MESAKGDGRPGGSELAARFVSLAHDRSPAGRTALSEAICELLLDPDQRYGDHELTLMVEILSKLIREVEISVRRHLATSLARTPNVPAELIELLANDEIEVARPVLLASEVLADPALLEIIRHRTREHRMAVAMRDRVRAAVADGLIARGEEDVIVALLRNPNAELSRAAAEYLVAESRRVDRYQEPLVCRADLPIELAYRMFWWVSSALRQYILEHRVVEPELVAELLERARLALMAEAHATQARLSEAEILVRRLANRGDLNGKFLLQALRQQHVTVFIAGLAHLGGFELETMRKIVLHPGGEALTVACKALEIDRGVFASIFLLTRSAIHGARANVPTALEEMLGLFDRLVPEKAKATVRLWQEDGKITPLARLRLH